MTDVEGAADVGEREGGRGAGLSRGRLHAGHVHQDVVSRVAVGLGVIALELEDLGVGLAAAFEVEVADEVAQGAAIGGKSRGVGERKEQVFVGGDVLRLDLDHGHEGGVGRVEFLEVALGRDEGGRAGEALVGAALHGCVVVHLAHQHLAADHRVGEGLGQDADLVEGDVDRVVPDALGAFEPRDLDGDRGRAAGLEDGPLENPRDVGELHCLGLRAAGLGEQPVATSRQAGVPIGFDDESSVDQVAVLGVVEERVDDLAALLHGGGEIGVDRQARHLHVDGDARVVGEGRDEGGRRHLRAVGGVADDASEVKRVLVEGRVHFQVVEAVGESLERRGSLLQRERSLDLHVGGLARRRRAARDVDGGVDDAGGVRELLEPPPHDARGEEHDGGLLLELEVAAHQPRREGGRVARAVHREGDVVGKVLDGSPHRPRDRPIAEHELAADVLHAEEAVPQLLRHGNHAVVDVDAGLGRDGQVERDVLEGGAGLEPAGAKVIGERRDADRADQLKRAEPLPQRLGHRLGREVAQIEARGPKRQRVGGDAARHLERRVRRGLPGRGHFAETDLQASLSIRGRDDASLEVELLERPERAGIVFADLDHAAVERDLRDEILGRRASRPLRPRGRTGCLPRIGVEGVEGGDVDRSIDDRLADADHGSIERDGLDHPATSEQRVEVDLGLDAGGGEDLARVAGDAGGAQGGVLDHHEPAGGEGHLGGRGRAPEGGPELRQHDPAEHPLARQREVADQQQAGEEAAANEQAAAT